MLPEEVATEGTERRLAEKLGDKLVALDFVHFVVFDGTAAPSNAAASQTKVISVQNGT